MKKPLNERMEETPLHELMPGFDKEAEWTKLSGKLHPKTRVLGFTWQRAAAILLLITVSSFGAWQLLKTNTNSNNQVATIDTDTKNEWELLASSANAPYPDSPIADDNEQRTVNIDEPTEQTNDIKDKTASAITSKKTEKDFPKYHLSGEFVCNGTPCPLEICIFQTIRCNNEQPSAISTCSILEPDQAKQLRFKNPNAAGENCKVTVDEIRIRRMTTGETIVLNAHSKPSTAEEIFNCLMGDEKCDLLAGVFQADCNNKKKTQHLKIDNKSGSLVVQ